MLNVTRCRLRDAQHLHLKQQRLVAVRGDLPPCSKARGERLLCKVGRIPQGGGDQHPPLVALCHALQRLLQANQHTAIALQREGDRMVNTKQSAHAVNTKQSARAVNTKQSARAVNMKQSAQATTPAGGQQALLECPAAETKHPPQCCR